MSVASKRYNESKPAKRELEESKHDARGDGSPPSSGEAAIGSTSRLEADRVLAPRPAPKARSIWARSFYRWAAISVVLGALYVLYFAHPYYRNDQFTPFRTIYPTACLLWLGLGLFYVKATLQRFGDRRYVLRDGGLHFLLLAKSAFGNILSRTQWDLVGILAGAALSLIAARALTEPSTLWHRAPVSVAAFLLGLTAVLLVARRLEPTRVWRVVRNKRVRTTLLSIVVKGFFVPLVTGFVAHHLNSITRAWLHHKHVPMIDFKLPGGSGVVTWASLWWSNVGVRLAETLPSGSDLADFVQPWTWTRNGFSWGLDLSYDLIFAVDCGFGLLGYLSESRWLGNKTRSVDRTALGWLACLGCYPPLNNVLGTYLPLVNGPELIGSDTIHLLRRTGVVLLFAIYASATASFGFKFSNLTNRGIVSRGPYRFVRHPAYLSKCCAWWLEHISTMTLTKAFFLSLLCCVYAVRAWTEERHLGLDPAYRAYKKKTRWMFIPGVY